MSTVTINNIMKNSVNKLYTSVTRSTVIASYDGHGSRIFIFENGVVKIYNDCQGERMLIRPEDSGYV